MCASLFSIRASSAAAYPAVRGGRGLSGGGGKGRPHPELVASQRWTPRAQPVQGEAADWSADHCSSIAFNH